MLSRSDLNGNRCVITNRLKNSGIRISMGGKGRRFDKVFIEPLGRSVKYEEAYLRACNTVADARSGLKRYFGYYNNIRTRQTLVGWTQDEVYVQTSGLREAA